MLLFNFCSGNPIEIIASPINFTRFAQAVLAESQSEPSFHVDLDTREDADQAMFAFQRLGCEVERDLAGKRLFVTPPRA